MKLRKVALVIHRILGIIIGLLIAVISLTGSLIVFDHELDRIFSAKLWNVIPQTHTIEWSTLLRAVNESFSGEPVEWITVPQTADQAYEFWLKTVDQAYRLVYLNPYTGEILGSRLENASLFRILFNLHVKLLSGNLGGAIVGISGIILIILGISGVLLWLPPRLKRLPQSFAIRWKAPARLLSYDLHKVGGVISVFWLCLISVTGVSLFFLHEQADQFIYWITNTPQPAIVQSKVSRARSVRVPLDLDQIIQQANLALPDRPIIYISIPQKPEGVFKVGKRLLSESSANSSSVVYLDQFSGDILRVNDPLAANLATRIHNALYPLHIGSYGGLGMRMLYFLIGFSPIGLFITGSFLLWQRIRRWS